MLHPDLVEVIEAVKDRPARITLEKFAELADVNLRWLQDLIAGKIKDPSFVRVARVRNCIESFAPKKD